MFRVGRRSDEEWKKWRKYVLYRGGKRGIRRRGVWIVGEVEEEADN